jgi:hypothetical protein
MPEVGDRRPEQDHLCLQTELLPPGPRHSPARAKPSSVQIEVLPPRLHPSNTTEFRPTRRKFHHPQSKLEGCRHGPPDPNNPLAQIVLLPPPAAVRPDRGGPPPAITKVGIVSAVTTS